MITFVVCIACGLFNIYNFITYIKPEWMLPFFRVAGDSSTLLRVINMLCLNWSPFIGLLLIIFGVVGLKVRESETNNFESFKYFMFVFSLATVVGLIL